MNNGNDSPDISSLFRSKLTSPGFLRACLLTIILTIIYTVFLLPGTGYQCDTAKFQYVGNVLGAPHATGFPTYLILNHLFTTFFPIGSLAFRANLLSAIFALAACLILFQTLRGVFKLSDNSAMITALTFGLTFTFWSQAIVAEVYTLHILFLIAVIYLFLKWRQTGKDGYFTGACALYALSFGNHLMMVLCLPAIVFFVLSTDKKVFLNVKKVMLTLLFIVLGAFQYSYFFWRYYAPDTPYLEMAVGNITELIHNISGAQYKSRMFAFSLSEIINTRFPWFFRQIVMEYLILIPIALWGMLKLRDKTVHLFLGLIFLCHMAFAVNYNINEIFVYLLPNYLIIAVYTGIGLDCILNLPARKKIAAVSAALLLIPVFFFTINQKKMAPFNDPRHAKKVETILETVYKDALIISPDDYYSQYFWYYLIGERLEAKRNIYLMHHFDPVQVTAYIRDNQRFYLPEERKYVPTGLKVYCLNQRQKKIFLDAGFRVKQASRFLFVIQKR